jgi:hypothetical protein
VTPAPDELLGSNSCFTPQIQFFSLSPFSARPHACLQGNLPFEYEDMANMKTTKKKASIPSGDGASAEKPAMEIVAEAAAAIAAPIVAKAAKLKRMIAPKVTAPADASGVAEPVPAPEEPSSKKPVDAKVARPKGMRTRATAPVAETAPAPPPPISGVTRPASKAKPASKPKAAARAGGGTAAPKKNGFTQDDVALRAYFIAQRRHADGRPGNPESDWLEAERELRAEHGLSAPR